MIERLSWVHLALITGSLFGFGIIFTNTVTRTGITVATTMTIFGVVNLIMGLTLCRWTDFAKMNVRICGLVLTAGILYFVGNLAQINAYVKAPFSGYIIIIVNIVLLGELFFIESLQQWKNGTLTINFMQVAALVLGLGSSILFIISAKK
jgi:hypothetical protein